MTQWRKKEKDATYSEEEIEARLKEELPGWYYEGGWIRRKYKTSGWKATLMVINTVGHLSEAAFHHPDLSASYAFVIVKLMNHAAKGVTDKFRAGEKDRGGYYVATGFGSGQRPGRYAGRSPLQVHQIRLTPPLS